VTAKWTGGDATCKVLEKQDETGKKKMRQGDRSSSRGEAFIAALKVAV